ncbi:MAG: hypothetical protein NTV04_02170 [Deltaproteobacteria bacterium]|nr:hypothetical protein [Deltaproteobacteria bacterium]
MLDPPGLENTILDGFAKSPSAALRFNFVVAAHLISALHSSVFARLASGAFYAAIVLLTFYEIIYFFILIHALEKSNS